MTRAIATRRYEWRDGTPIDVQIFEPTKSGKARYRCRFIVRSRIKEVSRRGSADGSDSLQAFLLSLQEIGQWMRRFEGRVSLWGNPSLSLPPPIAPFVKPVLEVRFETFLDDLCSSMASLLALADVTSSSGGARTSTRGSSTHPKRSSKRTRARPHRPTGPQGDPSPE
jgi:hypothetical protein